MEKKDFSLPLPTHKLAGQFSLKDILYYLSKKN
jgi:hypothetical protein